MSGLSPRKIGVAAETAVNLNNNFQFWRKRIINVCGQWYICKQSLKLCGLSAGNKLFIPNLISLSGWIGTEFVDFYQLLKTESEKWP